MKFSSALAFTDPTEFLELAKAADESGWDSMALSDHIFFPKDLASPYPYVEDGKPRWKPTTPFADPFVAIAGMAAVTTRLRFFTNVFILPARHPLLVAKAVSTASLMSGGRVGLGIGVGWMKEEFDVLEQRFAARGKRTDESIEILRRVWKGGMVEYHGEFYDFPPLQMSPAPTADIPIYVGGISKRALRRAARLGDGWIAVKHSTAELADYIAQINVLRREYGRENEPFEFIVAADDAYDLDGFRRLEDIGATTLITMPWMLYKDNPRLLQNKCAGLRRFGAEIIRKMH
jgi:probable F420-dependent oxidoreductase